MCEALRDRQLIGQPWKIGNTLSVGHKTPASGPLLARVHRLHTPGLKNPAGKNLGPHLLLNYDIL